MGSGAGPSLHLNKVPIRHGRHNHARAKNQAGHTSSSSSSSSSKELPIAAFAKNWCGWRVGDMAWQNVDESVGCVVPVRLRESANATPPTTRDAEPQITLTIWASTFLGDRR